MSHHALDFSLAIVCRSITFRLDRAVPTPTARPGRRRVSRSTDLQQRRDCAKARTTRSVVDCKLDQGHRFARVYSIAQLLMVYIHRDDEYMPFTVTRPRASYKACMPSVP